MSDLPSALPAPRASPAFDLATVRERLASREGAGQKYWRSLEEVAQTPEFYDWMHREFPKGASEWQDAPNRREFLKLMAGSLALAGLSACTRQPQEKIVPYVKQPEDLVPGIPLYYATAMTLGGFATGLLVESNEGRPTKIEGNPDHPFSLGAASVFHQAAILDLYDPDRTRTVLRGGETSSWEEFVADLIPMLTEQKAKGGEGLRILTETVTSPTLAAQLEDMLAQYPQAVWHQYEPLHRDHVREGARLAFGEIVETHYDFERAAVIVALDSDFLFTHPASLLYARQFANGRRLGEGPAGAMNRLYVVEPTPTITGTMADHRLPVAAREVAELTRELAAQVSAPSGGIPGKFSGNGWLDTALADLRKNPGTSIVLAGEGQPPEVHQLAHQINTALGNVGKTVLYRRSAEAQPTPQMDSLKALTEAMSSGSVDLLVVLGGNPVYNAPADIGFGEAMQKVRRRVQLAASYDETALLCHWHIPQAHFLEGWSDARAFDGTASIGQPLIEPLYEGRTAHELMDALLLRQNTRGSYDIVRAHWEGLHPGADFEKVWRKAIHDGLVASSASEARTPMVEARAVPAAPPVRPPGRSEQGLELVFRADGAVWDGRYSNNGWLQELPKPVTKLTWDNAALISPQLASRLKLANEDIVELAFEGRSLKAPVWVVPGQAENSVTLSLGYGRRSAGRVGTGQGVNANALRTSTNSYFGSGLSLSKMEGRWPLATTQHQYTLDGRDHYRAGTLAQYRQHPGFAPDKGEEPKKEDTLYPPDHTYPGYAWGMAIDLNTCIGCNACVIACQSENNIPIVGKVEVINGRAMHWIRVDSYYEGAVENPALHHQPVPCMHCENAPCEVVCPVEATLHSPEGLNEQIYNRCIGTRYCSNNCPYKVRRFNFLQWADNTTLSYKMQRNPDVTVRSRGVMEKCTYCVQRINSAKITSQKEDRKVRDGEIMTACQQSCPTDAIVFGDINDPASRVSRLKAQPRNYGMLAELNTRPRTTYLAKLSNPSDKG